MLSESVAPSPEARVRRADVLKAAAIGLILVAIGSTLFWPPTPSGDVFNTRSSAHFVSMLRQSQCLRMSERAAQCPASPSSSAECDAARRGTAWCQAAIADIGKFYK